MKNRPKPAYHKIYGSFPYFPIRLIKANWKKALQEADLTPVQRKLFEVPSPIPDELEGYEDEDAEGGYKYPCKVCEQPSDIYCEPEDFNPSMHYCGRSPRCCP